MKNQFLSLISFMLLVPALCLAQDFDREQMNKDIQIAQGILRNLFDVENQGVFFVDSRKNKYNAGQYVQDYGVILNVKSNALTYSYSYNTSGDGTIIIDQDEEKDDVKVKVAGTEDVIKSLKNYLVDYASLIHQLKPSDKILVNYQDGASKVWIYHDNSSTYRQSDNNQRTQISAEIDKQSLLDYKAGALSREQLVNKIIIREKENSETNKQGGQVEFRVFAEILKTLYSEDTEKDYRLGPHVSHNRIEGFGVSYQIDLKLKRAGNHIFISEDIIYDGKKDKLVKIKEGKKSKTVLVNPGRDRVIRVLPKSNKAFVDVEDTEAYLDSIATATNERYEAAMKDIEAGLKKHMIEYGRTLKSLASDEVLVLEVSPRFGYNWDIKTEAVSYLRLSVKKSVLEAFDKQEISLEEAQQAIKKESK